MWKNKTSYHTNINSSFTSKSYFWYLIVVIFIVFVKCRWFSDVDNFLYNVYYGLIQLSPIRRCMMKMWCMISFLCWLMSSSQFTKWNYCLTDIIFYDIKTINESVKMNEKHFFYLLAISCYYFCSNF